MNIAMSKTELLKRSAPGIIFLAALLLYGTSAGSMIIKQSETPQYVHLANSFLQGQLNLITLPRSTFDLISYQDKLYVPGGMTPALLLMPLVALFGVEVSDVLFGVLIGALNVALMYHLLEEFWDKVATRLWLTSLFAIGTVHWWVSSVGSVWFNAHVVAVMFMILFVLASLRGRPWLAGITFGLATLSRPTILFSATFYLLYILSRERNIRSALQKLIPFGIMTGLALVLMLAYNFARFGSPTEFGYVYVRGTETLNSTYSSTGGFDFRYMPCNIYVSVFGLPNLAWSPLPAVNEVCSYLEPITHVYGKLSSFFNPLGMSIFLTTPAFLLIFKARLKDDLVIPAWVGVISTLVPLWMYHTTGWVQFGYRYSLDFCVFLFILLSRAINRIGYLERILIGLSIWMGAIGLYLMYYMTFGLIWWEMFMDMARKFYHLLF